MNNDNINVIYSDPTITFIMEIPQNKAEAIIAKARWLCNQPSNKKSVSMAILIPSCVTG